MGDRIAQVAGQLVLQREDRRALILGLPPRRPRRRRRHRRLAGYRPLQRIPRGGGRHRHLRHRHRIRHGRWIGDAIVERLARAHGTDHRRWQRPGGRSRGHRGLHRVAGRRAGADDHLHAQRHQSSRCREPRDHHRGRCAAGHRFVHQQLLRSAGRHHG